MLPLLTTYTEKITNELKTLEQQQSASDSVVFIRHCALYKFTFFYLLTYLTQ